MSLNHINLPPMPYDQWEESLLYWQLMSQIIGKIRLQLHPWMNHWWHVTLYVTPRGTTTGAIPYGESNFDIELDLTDHKVVLRNGDGKVSDFPIGGGRSIANFYSDLFGALESIGIKPEILAKPYNMRSTMPFADDNIHTIYDPEAVHRGWTVLKRIEPVFKEFRSRFIGKCCPVHQYWHSFDLAVTRFSGHRASDVGITDPVAKEAYSHDVISAGFWFGDDILPQPAYYSYTWPAPEGLAQQPLKPEKAFWRDYHGAPQAILLYEDMRLTDDPHAALLDFLQSSYEAGANLAGWNREQLER